jgi:hypothetical protein
MFTIKKTHSLGRDHDGSCTERESFGRVALSSLETSTPITHEGIQGAKFCGILHSGNT